MSTFSTFDSTVNSFYLAFYGRPADPAGMKYWSQQLANNNGDFGAIVNAFADSQEAQTRFGSNTVAERISDIYMQLFNRVPDTDGMAYWMNAIDKGNASLGDVAFAILRGARGSDATLSELRQQAADAFTAEVEASGSQYDGYASIEAARVLVRAVTPDATQQDMDTLVKSAVSFADTATKTPMVVDAIAVNTTLLSLFDTTRGKGDPVALARALADTAKAAAGDPVTLESLLRGGGMDKVLKVMPAAATLKDVVKALADGGLPAAVEVVYPTAPSVKPAPATAALANLKFDSVSQHELDSDKSDNITNIKIATVKFSYTGGDLKSGQTLQYSLDGETWTSEGVSADAATNTVTIEGVNLTGKKLVNHASNGSSIQTEVISNDNILTTVRLQAVDKNKGVFAKGEAQIEYDGTAPAKSLYYIGLSSDAEPALTFGQFGGAEGRVQWRLNDTDSKWTDVTSFNQDGGFTLTGIDLSKTGQRLEMRVIDAAGNIGYTSSQDVEGPAQPLKFKVTPTAQGLQIESSERVDIRLYVDDNRYAPLGNRVGGEGATPFTIGAQNLSRTGELRIAPTGTKDEEVIGNGARYVLGTNQKDAGELKGQYVWGFGGDDTIYGTSGHDYLVGGRGADVIHLSSDGQSGMNTLVFAKGDTASGIYTGGEILLDEVIGAGIGDVLQLDKVFTATPSIGAALLTSADPNQVAVVRGVAGLNAFQPGSDSESRDYLIQWSDGDTVNSILLRNFGVVAPALAVDVQKGSMTLIDPAAQLPQAPETQPQAPSDSDSGAGSQPNPTPSDQHGALEPAKFTSAEFKLSALPSAIALNTAEGPVTGMMDTSGLSMSSYLSGVAKPISGVPYVFNDGDLQLGGFVKPGVYELKWDGNTFIAGSGNDIRPVNSGSLLFAGGNASHFKHSGFELDLPLTVDSTGIQHNASDTSEAIYSGTSFAEIVTGAGHDAVIGSGQGMNIGYSTFGPDAGDLVFGFASFTDTISFTGEAASKIDRSADSKITVSKIVDGKAFVVDGDEAVSIVVTTNIMAGNKADMEVTAAALRDYIDFSASHRDLLILATDGNNAGALFHYSPNGDNNQIDADELSMVAMFFNGAPTMDDIEIVGRPSMTPP